MTESYEQLRDGATGDGGDAWRAADRETGKLYALYRELKEDPRYSDDYKAEKAWVAYDANKANIEAGATEMAWSTRYDVDDGLRWDAGREVWVGSDGFAHDGQKLLAYSRGGRA